MQNPSGILVLQQTDIHQDANATTLADNIKVLTWKDRAIIALVAPLGRALIASLRIRLANSHHFTQLMDAGQPFIFVVWHSQLLLAVHTAAETGIVTLASPTRDGQIGAEVARRLGIESVTGDSRYQSLAALRLLARHLREGRSLGLFPDGPAGPARHMKPGPLVLARLGGCPLVPAAGFAPWSLRLPSHWDHFILPLPFSRVEGVVGEPLWIPRDASPGDLEHLARELERRLQDLEQRAHDLTSRRPPLR
ncbi:MAG: lysophospholipid acyltransferase family protein [Chromatiaceae bacterium]